LDTEALLAVMQTGMIARGAAVSEFETTIADYLGLKGGVATSSGTSALVLGLKSLGLEPGDEVILPTYVCRNVWDAVVHVGATPVLCDVGEDWSLDCSTVLPCLSSKTKGIIVVHMFGISVDIEALASLRIPIIENIAQAFGAETDGRKAGTFGQLAVCSFHATKCLTTGEGGMVLSNDGAILGKIRSVQALAPMSDIQAAIGTSQLRQYASFLHRRREIAEAYFDSLDQFPGVCMPARLRSRSMFFRFPLRTTIPFATMKEECEKAGISVRRGVDSLLHRIAGFLPASFPRAEARFAETLCIPIYPALADNEVAYIAEVSREILTKFYDSTAGQSLGSTS
jgi:UDP-4-amino-4-deoxy-L-arabinose-oxoglutarate aminotransferase